MLKKIKEYTTIDKSKWGAGEWQNEPDKIQFLHEETGLDALMVRHDRSGHWCGYVGVDETHPLFGKDYDSCYEGEYSDLDVHGGLTFASFCSQGKEAETICHVPIEGRSDKVWWLGFDLAHSGDKSPAYDRPINHGSYKNMNYVMNEIESLANQLKK